jgi:hypothetical protein
MVITSPSLTPARTPRLAIIIPPRTGATAMGSRRRIDCTVNPMARRPGGKASPMTAKTVGLAMLVHARASTVPAKIRGQDLPDTSRR